MSDLDPCAGTTQLLHDWQSGSESARDTLFERVYNELRKISAALLRGEGQVTLSTGDLVSEAAVRLIKLDQIDWQNKAHFMAMAAKVMRRVLIDHARAKGRNKRHHQKVTLLTKSGHNSDDALDLMSVENALLRLAVLDKQRADIVELRYYGGLSFEDTAEVLGMSVSTAKRKWRSARAWLLTAIKEEKLLSGAS